MASNACLSFELFAWRILLEARGLVRFPPGKGANVLRGALGSTLRELVCSPDCVDATACSARFTCPYARLFAPSALPGAPSGLRDLPRPFVLRAAHLDGRTFRPGSVFFFDLHLFIPHDPPLDAFLGAFDRLAEVGLGPGREPARLTRAEPLPPGRPDGEPHRIDLSPPPDPISRLRVRFLTPTELKAGERVAGTPEFGILFARVRDRVSALRAVYGAGPLPVDFQAIGERANGVRLVHVDLRHHSVERRSSRTGQTHPLGGFTGEAEYEGELTEFAPLLEAARWTGVGRQTVWGKGAIEVLDRS
ncbi:MAG: CRISPR system precrRNA processing endoribonuclease RAMP protein Cas6 [Bryobacteraceae bacterium]